jgi:virulence-associated protein VagC
MYWQSKKKAAFTSLKCHAMCIPAEFLLATDCVQITRSPNQDLIIIHTFPAQRGQPESATCQSDSCS